MRAVSILGVKYEWYDKKLKAYNYNYYMKGPSGRRDLNMRGKMWKLLLAGQGYRKTGDIS